MTSSRRAVLTGVGVVTPIGLDAASFRRSLREGRGGVRPAPSTPQPCPSASAAKSSISTPAIIWEKKTANAST